MAPWQENPGIPGAFSAFPALTTLKFDPRYLFAKKVSSLLIFHVHAIEFSRQAAQALKAMPRNVATIIRTKLDALAADPYAPNPNARKLAGRDGYRLRVGDWRVLYQIEHGRLVIMVLAIKPRGGAYQ
ncbi:type II toxin-antitoxin system RelE family toxin [Cupriavidus lacunae]|uniref:type II toxin-antitoxin system RelE family toxin n=1 Tax=Cupriavidus lacunae TaxID=2666307 RepID=UPI001FC9E720|nr:type II toxin-antitoxin system RelE/ParE family toxin [Cupriavidus lacunae]